MLGLEGIALPASLAGIFGVLEPYGVDFGVWIRGDHLQTLPLIAALFLIVLLAPNTQQWRMRDPLDARSAGLGGAAFAVSVLSLTRISEFLYFQF